MLAILGFQPIYNTCIENYLVPTSRIIGERGEVMTAGARDAIMSRRIMLLLPFPVLLCALLSPAPLRTACPPPFQLQHPYLCVVSF